MRGNGARTILVENASRFVRDPAVQIVGHDLLKQEGFTLLPADSPDSGNPYAAAAVMRMLERPRLNP